MANELTTGTPLAAPLGEQLREKAHLDELRAAERAPERAQAQRVERRKAEEREAALRHAAARPGAPGAREAGRGGRAAPEAVRAAGHPKWPVLLGGLALFGVVALLRRLTRR